MWEYNADKADASLELRSKNLIARINDLLKYSRKKGSFHNLCEMVRIGGAGEAAFAQKETKLGLGGTYIENKNTEYSIVRRVRAQYWSQKTPRPLCLPDRRQLGCATSHQLVRKNNTAPSSDPNSIAPTLPTRLARPPAAGAGFCCGVAWQLSRRGRRPASRQRRKKPISPTRACSESEK